MTYAEYLAMERSATEKHEFVNGHVFAMAGARFEHNGIHELRERTPQASTEYGASWPRRAGRSAQRCGDRVEQPEVSVLR